MAGLATEIRMTSGVAVTNSVVVRVAIAAEQVSELDIK